MDTFKGLDPEEAVALAASGEIGASGESGVAAASPAKPAVSLAEIRERFATKRGPELWRSLDELADSAEFQDLLHREFPRYAAEWPEGVSRRGFLQLASASMALAGLTGCTRQPLERIVPYVRQPEQIIPGRPLYFATALTHAGYALGVLAESHMGRPTKIEGNPDHPASLGATDTFSQAQILTLYDPARSQSITSRGEIRTWGSLIGELAPRLQAQQALGGVGLRILTGTVTSPTLTAQLQNILQSYPQARWHQWEAAGHDHGHAAAVRAFGAPLATRYDFSRAQVVVSVQSDFLAEGPGAVRYSRDFAAGRRVRKDRPAMTRYYAVESTPTCSGSLADHRLPLPPAEVEAALLGLASALGVVSGAPAPASPAVQSWVQAAAADLQQSRGASVVVGGEYLSPAAQVLVHAINQALGNVGSTVFHTAPVEAAPVHGAASLGELVRDMRAGAVEVLLILGTNPVYTAPADLAFGQALEKVGLRIHHGLFEDETAYRCHWHIPATHELESWGDARAFDGTATLLQPLIEPLYGGKTETELLALLQNRPDASAYDLLREFWGTRLPGDFEPAFRSALHAGVVPDTQLPPASAGVAGGAVAQAGAEVRAAVDQARSQKGGGVTLAFRPDPTVWDGCFAPNGWLQELPKPITKLAWDNALLLSPRTAERLGLGLEEMVEITAGPRKLRAAVWVLPGQADDTATITLGYGRERAGQVGSNLGFNAYRLRTSNALWTVPGATVRGLGEKYTLASTQNHHVLESGAREMPVAMAEAARRNVVRTGTLAQFQADPTFVQHMGHVPSEEMNMYPPYEYNGNAWGMAIDLNTCTGCSACVIACQSENNIPVVGKEQVLRGREMHWLRIDRYFSGDLDNPRIHHQPLPCMHCENAPCEVVCPVAATVHSDEGLNDMVYNRCVGTRYCSNNCPYKVRRFNFLRYSNKDEPVLKLAQNPDVTLRMRGVMEKCTYCVQRIEQAKIDSKVERKPIPELAVQTACAQACPTQAIVFGDTNNPEWQVSRWKADPLNYGLLEDLNTRPRTTYLAKIHNPHPQLAPAPPAPHGTDATERTEHGHH
jgi:MoCo/4Fe-4S cofactor protein with predicted Tat translocation signal